MRDLEDQLVVCMRCGMCQAVCPVFTQTGREADVARGKLALLDGLMQEMFQDPRGVSERLNKCLLCGSCGANCPSGVSALDIFLKARAILAGYMGLSPAKKMLLRGMLSHPETFDRLAQWGAKFQKLLIRPVNDVVGTSCARIVSPLLSQRHFKPLAPLPFHRLTPALNTEPGKSGIKAGFFVGCLIDKIFPAVAQAVVDVLKYHGVGIYLPEGQGCCGIPALSCGDTETFQRLLRHNLGIFERDGVDYLITACATCTSTIKEIWPVMVSADAPGLKDRVAALSDKTLDINQFLVSKVGLQKFRNAAAASPAVATYHDPCHLKNTLGVFDEPRALINAAPEFELVEMTEADACCGMGGSFNLQYYDISARIGKLKRDNIQATGCSLIATGCPACMMQISDALSKAGDRIAVRHPVEIYADSIKNDENTT